jgi:hypothetical protein
MRDQRRSRSCLTFGYEDTECFKASCGGAGLGHGIETSNAL